MNNKTLQIAILILIPLLIPVDSYIIGLLPPKRVNLPKISVKPVEQEGEGGVCQQGVVNGGFLSNNNRLVHDYASGTSMSGLTVRSGGSSLLMDERFLNCIDRETGCIVGCVDFVWRAVGSRGELPNHVHCKNMVVKEGYRRRGIGRELMEGVRVMAEGSYKGTDTVECMTLEVDDDNEGAIRLYRKIGFGEPESIGGMGAKGKYGTVVVGRSFMVRDIPG